MFINFVMLITKYHLNDKNQVLQLHYTIKQEITKTYD